MDYAWVFCALDRPQRRPRACGEAWIWLGQQGSALASRFPGQDPRFGTRRGPGQHMKDVSNHYGKHIAFSGIEFIDGRSQDGVCARQGLALPWGVGTPRQDMDGLAPAHRQLEGRRKVR